MYFAVIFFQNLKKTKCLEPELCLDISHFRSLRKRAQRYDQNFEEQQSACTDYEGTRHIPRFNVCCALSKQKIFGPLHFADRIVNGVFYLDMFGKLLMLIPSRNKRVMIFQQDGAAPCFHTVVGAAHLGLKFSK
jgi:hypothetical protein